MVYLPMIENHVNLKLLPLALLIDLIFGYLLQKWLTPLGKTEGPGLYILNIDRVSRKGLNVIQEHLNVLHQHLPLSAHFHYRFKVRLIDVGRSSLYLVGKRGYQCRQLLYPFLVLHQDFLSFYHFLKLVRMAFGAGGLGLSIILHVWWGHN